MWHAQTFYSQADFLESPLFKHLFSNITVLVILEEPVHLCTINDLCVLLSHWWRIILIPIQNVVIHQDYHVTFSISMLQFCKEVKIKVKIEVDR